MLFPGARDQRELASQYLVFESKVAALYKLGQRFGQ